MTNKYTPISLLCLSLLAAGCSDSSSGGNATASNNGGGTATPPANTEANGQPANENTGTPETNAPVAVQTPANTPPVAPPAESPAESPAETPAQTPPANSGNPNEAPTFTNADAALSHTGERLPSGPAALPGSQFVSETGRSRIAALPQPLAVMYEIVENHGDDFAESCKTLQAAYASCSIANIHIKDSSASLDGGDWRIYFPAVRRVLRVDSNEFSITHVNGDLHYIEPAAGFSGFANSSVKTIQIFSEFSQLHESDMMPRYFLVRDGQAPELIANTDNTNNISGYGIEISAENAKAFNGEPAAVANSENRFDKFAQTSQMDVSAAIIPTPASTTVTGGSFDISAGLNFPAGVLPAASAGALNAKANLLVGGGGNTVAISIDSSLQPSTYRLDVSANGISIAASDAESAFYGGQSLIALITPGVGNVPQLSVTDSPRFDYRGMHLDVARNFHPVSSVRKLIDQMAAYKMNVLHMHLTDDEGWRLEIPSLPELASVGGTRQFALDSEGNPTEASGLLPQLGSGPFSNNSGSGFYSRNEFIDLLRYAADRYITVIPEIDMPAHARAAVVAMRARAANLGQPGNTAVRIDDPADTSRYQTVQHYTDGIINPCVPGTYNFISTVIADVRAMYNDAGTSLDVWHMGGDEANNIFLDSGFQDLSEGSSIPWKGDIDQSQFDFPWESSPACQAMIASDSSINNLDDLSNYFVKRVSQIVNDAGIPSMYAYQDILSNLNASELATQNSGVGFWEVVWEQGANNAYDWPQRGFETIVAVPDYLYFDFPQEIDPKERGYYWATRFTDTQKVFSFAPENLPQNSETSVNREGIPFQSTGNFPASGFRGMQGQLWGETIRTAEHFDYMIFPRLLALAERAWHRAPWELDYVAGVTFSGSTSRVDQSALAADWNRFANVLGQKELSKLDSAGVLYRVPTAGAKLVNGSLQVNTQYPGLTVQHSADGSNWVNYNPASAPSSAQSVRAVSANGARNGRATPVN